MTPRPISDPSTGSGSSRAKSRDDESFPKDEHILKTKGFKGIYKKGSITRGGGLVFYCLPNGLPTARIGFSISAVNVKRAARRNWIRRRLREIYRRGKKNLKKGFDIAIVVKRDPGKDFPYKDLENLFLNLARRAGIFNE